MHDKLMKMMAKKRNLSPSEKSAKMDVVKDLRQAAGDMMGSKLDGLKKVSVMANSKEGLKHGLDKARGIVSDGDEHQMLRDASAPYSDAKHANMEHDGEDESNSMGQMDEGDEQQHLSDGGPVQPDPKKTADAQQSMRDAFHFNDGGEVDSPDQGEYEAVDQESPAEHEEGMEDDGDEDDEKDEDNEFHGLDIHELNDKLQKLMKLHKKMSKS
jgi:hypothetical protein